MKEWITNNKKKIAIGGAVIIIVIGGIFGMNVKKHYVPTTTLYIGQEQEDRGTISYDVDGITNQENVDKVEEILANAQVSDLTDEALDTLEGRKLYFIIDTGNLQNNTPQNSAEIWIQEDGSAIYREGLTKQYYTIDKEAVKQLEKLLK